MIKTTLASLCVNPEALTTALLVAYLDHFTVEGLTWLPETIELELNQLCGQDISSATLNKILTGITLLTSNSFLVSLPDFMYMCLVLNNQPVLPHTLDLPSCEDLAWGLTEGLLLSQFADEEVTLTPEITGYIEKELQSEGILVAPDILKIATHNNLLENIKYDYSDDPELFTAIYQTEQAKTNEITNNITTKTLLLIQQLESLILKHANTQALHNLLAKITKSIGQTTRQHG